MKNILINSVELFVNLLYFFIFVRAIMSWFRPPRYSKLYDDISRALYALTEPILAPIRNILPTTGMGIDLSPLVAIFLLDIARRVVVTVLQRVL